MFICTVSYHITSFCQQPAAHSLAQPHTLHVCMCVCMCVLILCVNVLDVQTWRHFPNEIAHCFQRGVVPTQPAIMHAHTNTTHTNTQIHNSNAWNQLNLQQNLVDILKSISLTVCTHITDFNLDNLVKTSAMCSIPASFRLLSLKLQRENKSLVSNLDLKYFRLTLY